MPSPVGLFRQEAVEAHDTTVVEGDLLRLSPHWVGRTYRLLLLATLFAVGYSLIGRVAEYAEGPLVIELEGRLVESATTAGTVARVRVRPGDRVSHGQVLVELNDGPEQAELARIERAFELSLLDLLRDPGSASASATLTSLRSERQLAVARIDERIIRAHHVGIVGDVRIRDGERVEPGQPVVAIIGEDDQVFVTAVLPGRYGPLLVPGMPLLVELAGFRGTEHQATITGVGGAVVGPDQVRRTLGFELGDAITVPDGPALLVRARLPSRTFTAEGESLYFHHGMTGRAQVKVRTRSLLVTVFPALGELW
jgi:multidrug efflux pump subunit AcrA (membrane-fusion protein)